mgnify:CR=1 FL=1
MDDNCDCHAVCYSTLFYTRILQSMRLPTHPPLTRVRPKLDRTGLDFSAPIKVCTSVTPDCAELHVSCPKLHAQASELRDDLPQTEVQRALFLWILLPKFVYSLCTALEMGEMS